MLDSLGELKKFRKSKGLSLHHVAGVLKIKESYLRAIEEKDYAQLPEYVYAVGFIKNYATFLGADCEAAVEQFKRRDQALDSSLFDFTDESADDCVDCGSCVFRKYIERLSRITSKVDGLPYFGLVCILVVVVGLMILMALL
ncbi:MAG: helix-turn-helix domain-containing protein [Holosporaceae bacterium]|jgi:transcriptional regulator with XRE-family HTH domain|nr:helix-turn-helix domain-containing protein [Holosporaceae bacterium]